MCEPVRSRYGGGKDGDGRLRYSELEASKVVGRTMEAAKRIGLEGAVLDANGD